MKIVIVRKPNNETKSLIAGQFPNDWKLVFVSSKELETTIENADVLIPENEIVKFSLLDKARSLKLTRPARDMIMCRLKHVPKKESMWLMRLVSMLKLWRSMFLLLS